MNNALDWIDDELATLAAQGLRRQQRAHAGPQGPTFVLDGRSVVNFGSNDYLGLAADDRLASAATGALSRSGSGGGASPLLAGRGDEQLRLEERLAKFERCEAAMLFSSGYAANVGVIPALVGRGDAILADELNHASLIDGCRLSRAEVYVHAHGDWRKVERLLHSTAGARRRLIVTDSLFSMDGDLAPLVELADLAARHDAMLLVDEAHATGIFGAEGRGVCEELGVERGVAVRVGTLSKSLGSAGGFVCGERRLIEWLANRARSYVFSTAPAPSACAAARAAIDVVVQQPQRRRQLRAAAALLRDKLQAQGWDTGDSTSQIVPIIVGDPQAAVDLSNELLQRGMYVPAIRPPSVRAGKSRLRISLAWGHDAAMIDALAQTLAQFAPAAASRMST